MVDQGYDLVAPIPSCVLMFKQELPLLFPDDAQVQKVQAAMFDPFEYLMRCATRRACCARISRSQLGKVSYHVPCHLRVQNIGLKTRDVLQLVPGTEVEPIERCSGHDGTYGVKKEYRETSMKIGRPVFSKVRQRRARPLRERLPDGGPPDRVRARRRPRPPTHPLTLLRMAYGI